MSPEIANHRFDVYLRESEAAIYIMLAVLLSITALLTLLGAGQILLQSVVHWTVATEILRVLDQLLLVLMLMEILHTSALRCVRMSCSPPNPSWLWA